MSTAPSLYVLIALVPFVYLLDAEDMDAADLEKLIGDATADKDTITETPAEMVAQGLEYLVPMRDALEEKGRDEMRAEIKDDYGVEGYSRSKKSELVQFFLTDAIGQRSRFAALEAERIAIEAASAKRLADIAAGAAAPPKPAGATSEPREVASIPASEPVGKWPATYRVREIEVLVQFFLPTKAGKDGKTPSAAPVAKSLYREGIKDTVYNYALAIEAKKPGWMTKHIQIRALHG